MIVWVVFTPRVGSSMLMRMLDLGGLPAWHDGQPQLPSDANPNGYYESVAVKSDAVAALSAITLINYAVKVPARFVVPLMDAGLIPTHALFPIRPIEESKQSWANAFQNQPINGSFPQDWEVAVQNLSNAHQSLIQHEVPVLDVFYHEIVDHPREQAEAINTFLGGTLNANAMAAVPDQSLRHYFPA